MKYLKLLPLLGLFFFSCEDFNCLIPREPELPNKSFSIASLDNYYYSDLTAEINNEPRDNDYDYFFDVVGLPLGMDFFVNNRIISIEGTPEEEGTYEFTIFLDVDGPFREFDQDQQDFLCDYSTQKTYTLIVEEL
ncbi:MAG: hypothetical protein AB8B52_12995 [Winogradskyella sp.]|uniref:hypothetical protein n=1 Tax=Winogradskyella sp. TaxID=1883156 RepID=UPI00385F2D8F